MKTKIKHGACVDGKQAPEYNTWLGIKQRCYKQNCCNYKRYGGIGIKMCDRWHGQDGFKNFLTDMGEKPIPKNKYSIERINPYGDYTPENCIWADAITQASNHRIRFIKKTCFVCEVAFLGNPERKYCSLKCGTYYRRHQEAGQPKVTKQVRKEKECLVCSKSFAGTSWQKYCSPKCRRRNEQDKVNSNRLLKSENKVLPYFDFKCVGCNQNFKAFQLKKKYCTRQCKNADLYQKRKIKKLFQTSISSPTITS